MTKVQLQKIQIGTIAKKNKKKPAQIFICRRPKSEQGEDINKKLIRIRKLIKYKY